MCLLTHAVPDKAQHVSKKREKDAELTGETSNAPVQQRQSSEPAVDSVDDTQVTAGDNAMAGVPMADFHTPRPRRCRRRPLRYRE